MLASALMSACGGAVIEDDGQNDAASQEDAPRADPLEGTWRFTAGDGEMTIGGELIFESNGSLSEALQITQCTGMESFSGATWTSTASTVTVMTGTEACTGSLDCGGATTTCTPGMGAVVTSTCHYALSHGDDTLTLSDCDGDPDDTSVVLTRQ
jgi:hypothetical protein